MKVVFFCKIITTYTTSVQSSITVTVSENEYGTFAILWSKSAVFRGAWQDVNMQLQGLPA